MIDDREIFKELLSTWHAEWKNSGRPLEATAPTLKTYLSNETPYSQFIVLNGNLRNIQPIYEGLVSGGEIPEYKEEDIPPTTLDKACGFASSNQSEILLARVASYTSEQTKDEANATALSCYMYGLTPENEQHTLFNAKEHSEDDFIAMRGELAALMGDNAELFLTRLFSYSTKSFNIKNAGKPEPIVACIEFWFEYGEWRAQFDSTK